MDGRRGAVVHADWTCAGLNRCLTSGWVEGQVCVCVCVLEMF